MTNEGLNEPTESQDHASMLASSFDAVRNSAYYQGQADGYRSGRRAGTFRTLLGIAGFAAGSYLANGHHLPFMNSENSSCETGIDFDRDGNGQIVDARIVTECD